MSKVKEVFGTKAKTRKVKRKRNKNITYGQMVVDEHLVRPPSCQGEYRSSTQASSSTLHTMRDTPLYWSTLAQESRRRSQTKSKTGRLCAMLHSSSSSNPLYPRSIYNTLILSLFLLISELTPNVLESRVGVLSVENIYMAKRGLKNHASFEKFAILRNSKF